MTNLKKHFVLILLVLSWAAALNGLAWAEETLQPKGPRLPSTGPGSYEVSAGFETGHGVSQTRTIHVIGRGTIYRDDVARARDNAIADALQDVVEDAVDLLISPSSVVQDIQLLSDRVYSQTEEFIHEYKVLTESKSGKYYRVVVRATVSMKAIQEKLASVGILTGHKEVPAVMFFVSEQNIGDFSPQYWWGEIPFGVDLSVSENVLSDYMRKRGLIVVDRASLDRDVRLGPEYVDSELNDDAAIKLGTELGADLVIIGKSIAQLSGNVSNSHMKSIQASVSTRAINTDTGTIVASAQATKGLVGRDDRAGGTEALVLASSALAQDLTGQIVAKWGEEVRQSIVVELVVQGIKEYADFVRFRRHLRSDIRGVKNVYLRSISADGAKMDVDVMGNARDLADDLMLQPFENLAVNIFEVTEKVVKLQLISSPTPDR